MNARDKVVFEVLETEISYVQSLTDILEVYAKPLKKSKEAKKAKEDRLRDQP